MGFEPWMLAAMDDAGFNGITDEHIRRVAREIQEIGQACMNYMAILAVNPLLLYRKV